MTQLDYTVRLEMFEGPLDLLLYLIRRAEVEIADIPIAQITEQYLRFIDQFDVSITEGAAAARADGAHRHATHRRPLDIERAGEFLVMAATLMEIKSRMLAPARAIAGMDESGDGGAGESGSRTRSGDAAVDPRAELVRQLLDYKRFRDATQRLEEYRDEFFARFPTAAAPRMEGTQETPPESGTGAPDADAESALVDLEDTTIVDLVEAFARIMQTVDFTRVGEHRVVFDDTPIELHAEDILHRLRERKAAAEAGAVDETGIAEIEFVEIFRGRSRSEAIGLFLAVLELVKEQRVSVRQEAGPAGEPDAARIVLALLESKGHPVPAEAGAARPAAEGTGDPARAL